MYEPYNLCDVNEMVLKSFAHVEVSDSDSTEPLQNLELNHFQSLDRKMAHHLDGSQAH